MMTSLLPSQISGPPLSLSLLVEPIYSPRTRDRDDNAYLTNAKADEMSPLVILFGDSFFTLVG